MTRVSRLFLTCHLRSPLSVTVASNTTCGTNWIPEGVIVAGNGERGGALSQLYGSRGFYVGENQTVLVADSYNSRIVEWKLNATAGRLVAGGSGEGNQTDQLVSPSAVIADKETDTLIICDKHNRRVVRWPRRDGSNGTTIIDNIACAGLTLDTEGSLYAADDEKLEVRRYPKGQTSGILVAGGNGKGDGFHQFNYPTSIFIDRDRSVYVADQGNHRVMKWKKDTKIGVVVAGGHGRGNGLSQLHHPTGVSVDADGIVYVVDYWNHRVMRWCKNAKLGSVSVGGNGQGKRPDQFNQPWSLVFDLLGNLYVNDQSNYRIQRFSIRNS